MNITRNTVVALDFELTDDAGRLIDSSEGRTPVTFVQGHGALVAGLEKEIEGKAAGAEFKVRVPPEEGYGAPNPALIQDVPREIFEGMEEVEPGMRIEVSGPDGPLRITVTELKGDQITIDGNHPLAGKHLNYDIKIRGVREASDEEIKETQQNCSCC